MKSIVLISLFFFTSNACFAQKIKLSDTLSINLPAKTEKLNREQFSSYITSKFSRSHAALDVIPQRKERLDNKHFYNVDGILVKLVHGERSSKNKDSYLAETKKRLDEMNDKYKTYDSYSSTIRMINNSVLIIYKEFENVGYYKFFMNDNSNSFALNGALQFDKADRSKATKVLDTLLSGVEFNK